MGIQIIDVPRSQPRVHEAGLLSLPATFDVKKFAAKWVKVGPAVAAAAEREFIIGTEGVTADGWIPWHDGKGNTVGKPFKVSLQGGEHILLCRPRDVQDAVNAICGNLGKERMLQEKRGETTGGIPTSDPGMLSDARLSKVIGKEDFTAEEGDVILNKVSGVKRVEPRTMEVSEPAT